MHDSTDEELMPQVFAVEDLESDMDLGAPPTSGQEYLRRVMLEAKQHPMVVVATIDSKLLEKRQPLSIHLGTSLIPAPRGYAPSLEWQQQQAEEFSQVRQHYKRYTDLKNPAFKYCKKLSKYKKHMKKETGKTKRYVPQKGDVNGWCRLCFGDLKMKRPWDEGSTTDEEKRRKGKPPLLSVVSHMDQPTVAKVLEYHINWFEATGFSVHQGMWFYALLASLEMPLEPEVCSLLRTLSRHCSTTRATLESTDDELLAPLNLIICLVARYFNQADLGDSG